MLGERSLRPAWKQREPEGGRARPAVRGEWMDLLRKADAYEDHGRTVGASFLIRYAAALRGFVAGQAHDPGVPRERALGGNPA